MNTGVAPALAQNVESSRDAAPMKSRLVFDHLPKTAGTSISAALEAMFGLSGALPAVSNQHSGVMATAGDRRVLAGHLWRRARAWIRRSMLTASFEGRSALTVVGFSARGPCTR